MQQQLTVLRIIWGSMLMAQLVFLAVTLAIGNNMPPPDPQKAQLHLYLAIGMLALLLPIAYLQRANIYRKGRDADGLIARPQYFTGNIIFWAMCEGVGLAAINFGLINRGQGPVLFVAAVAIAVLVVNFPTGSTMRRE